ncbi:hypothetical protein FRC17_010860 [Serendipita sp. 399]|nr:hypothetical protein FRC17_010860 [Serendipita sp. 399]
MAYRLKFNDIAEDSHESSGTMPEISLGSLEESFKSPPRPLSKQPPPLSLTSSSTMTNSTSAVPNKPDATPKKGLVRRGTDEEVRTPKASNGRNAFLDDSVEDDDEVTATSDRKWESDSLALPRLGRGKQGTGPAKVGVNMTLREQEKVIDQIKKENFSLKLKVHFLEERLAQLAPDHIEAALKQNINLKIEVQSRGVELKKYKKLLLQMEQELARIKTQDNRAREEELQAEVESLTRELRELRRRKMGSGRDDVALTEARGRNEELEQRLVQLEDELEGAKALIEENLDEIERLREGQGQNPNGSSVSESGESRRAKLEEALRLLEEDNAVLQERLEQFANELNIREDEKEELADKIEALTLHIEDLERRQQMTALERSQSRANMIEDEEERQNLEDSINALRDKLAATNIELQQKEEEISAKSQEIEEIIAEHESIVRDIEANWRGEVAEARQQVDDMRDLMVEKEKEETRLREQVADLEANTAELHTKFEAALAHLESQAEAREEEIIDANQQITELSEKLWKLEEALEQERDEVRIRLDEADIERERTDMVLAALKEKLATAKEQQQEATELYETCREQIVQHRQREEELAQHAEDLIAEINAEREAREDYEEERDTAIARFDELDVQFRDARREWEESARRERRTLDETEAALTTVRHDLDLAKELLSQRESDIAEIQAVLSKKDAESRRLGESVSSDRFALNLELERHRRDIARGEEEIARLKKELEERDARARDREAALDKLHVENRDIAAQLAAQTQARLNLSEKLDTVQANLKVAETEVSTLRAKVSDLETRLNKDQRSQVSLEHQYRDQLTERNTLLLTVYQYLDRILGVDKTTKAETKPFTNFAVFHDNLISRLKAVTNIQGDFEKRCKEAEAKFMERLAEVKKQLDFRWKQLDRFETSVKSLAEVKHTWRRKYSAKEGELEAAKARYIYEIQPDNTNAELSAQISSLRRQPSSDNSELRALTARAVNAERRLTNAQNQLAATEERINSMNEKTVSADTKWEARVREYEARLKAAEERVKRERQGGKERINELEANIANLRRQLEYANRRNSQLGDIVEMNRPTDS